VLGNIGVFSDEALDRIPAESPAADAGKDWLFGLTVLFSQPGIHRSCRLRAQRRATLFSAFSQTTDMGSGSKHDILAVQSNQLGNTQTGLNSEEKKRAIT